jgi:fatty acid desaturase
MTIVTPFLLDAGGRTRTAKPSAAAHLTDEQIDKLGRELDALRESVIATRGAKDAAYIRRVIGVQRSLELAGRAALLFGKHRPAWIAGTGMLTVAKILENMEIGHNVLHGQWDWMRDPDIHSTTWEWDFVTPSRAWQHTHNDLHHTWTNVVGKDRDVGYTILRMDEDQEWKPWNLGNPVYNALLAPVFEWGIAIYDLELDEVREGRKPKSELRRALKALGAKFVKQAAKDYAATPAVAALTGSGKHALAGTLAANAARNVWAHAVIFCGHFPAGVDTFTE